MIAGVSHKIGFKREFSGGQKCVKKRLEVEQSKETMVVPKRHPKSGKGLQRLRKMERALKGGRSRFQSSSKGGSGPANWGANEDEARHLGYDDDEVQIDHDEAVTNLPIEQILYFSFDEKDVRVKCRTKKPILVQPEAHRHPEKQYATKWLNSDESLYLP